MFASKRKNWTVALLIGAATAVFAAISFAVAAAPADAAQPLKLNMRSSTLVKHIKNTFDGYDGRLDYTVAEAMAVDKTKGCIYVIKERDSNDRYKNTKVLLRYSLSGKGPEVLHTWGKDGPLGTRTHPNEMCVVHEGNNTNLYIAICNNQIAKVNLTANGEWTSKTDTKIIQMKEGRSKFSKEISGIDFADSHFFIKYGNSNGKMTLKVSPTKSFSTDLSKWKTITLNFNQPNGKSYTFKKSNVNGWTGQGMCVTAKDVYVPLWNESGNQRQSIVFRLGLPSGKTWSTIADKAVLTARKYMTDRDSNTTSKDHVFEIESLSAYGKKLYFLTNEHGGSKNAYNQDIFDAIRYWEF